MLDICVFMLLIYSTASPVDNYEREQTINLLAFFSIRNFVRDIREARNFWAVSNAVRHPLSTPLDYYTNYEDEMKK